MGSSIYEHEYPTGDKARWIREADGTIAHWVGHEWKFRLTSETWDELVRAMDITPLRNETVPLVGEITGWRCWRVHGDMLWSLYSDYVWVSGDTQEGYVGETKGGLYAFKCKSRAVSESANAKWETPIAVGSVALWGDAIEAENGWRAQYAKILSVDYISVSKNAHKDYDTKQEPIRIKEPRLFGLLNRTTIKARPDIPVDGKMLLRNLQNAYVGG